MATATAVRPATNGASAASPAAAPTTALAIKLSDGQLDSIDSIVEQCSMTTLSGLGRVRQAMLMAAGIAALKSILTNDAMAGIMPLQNTKIGFRCDKNYDVDIVRNCLIEALLRGVWVVGNEFNIIASTMYITKEGFTRLLREFPGLTDLKLKPGVPIAKNGGVVVHYEATWKISGRPDSIERDIPIKVNNGMGADAILGKAERKIRCAIYNQLTGSAMSDGEIEDSGRADVTPGTQTLEDLTKKLNGGDVAGLDLSPGERVAEGGEIVKDDPAPEETTQETPAPADWRTSPLTDHRDKLGGVKVLSLLKHAKLETLGDLMTALNSNANLGLNADQSEKVNNYMVDVMADAEQSAST